LSKRKGSLSIKTLIVVFALISGMVLVFYSVISARGFDFNYDISHDIKFDPNGLIPELSPFLSFIVLLVFSYFGFGFYYISIYVTEVWIVSVTTVGTLLPYDK